ncbi:MAG TPA: glucokinase, partial [Firmicutes bacterium]|nr:glucokinase [Bacillota bacterium]
MKTVIIGIDLGGTNTQGAAATLDGVIIRQSKIATRA